MGSAPNFATPSSNTEDVEVTIAKLAAEGIIMVCVFAWQANSIQ